MKIAAPLNCDPEPRLQTIEVSSTFQLPGFHIVGLPSREVAEARERVRAAIQAEGYEFPRRRVLLNLAPADIQKRGTGMDLAIALSVLNAADEVHEKPGARERLIVASGELGLDGRVKPVGQTTRALYAAWKAGADLLILSRSEPDPANETIRLIRASGHGFGFPDRPPGIIRLERLSEAWLALQQLPAQGNGQARTAGAGQVIGAPDSAGSETQASESGPLTDGAFGFSDCDEQKLLPLSPALERTVCLAAAGSHHLMMLGPKGVGKSHALEWLMRLLPPPSPEMLLTRRLMTELHPVAPRRGGSPFRRISTAARPSALVGSVSASLIRPGELTLAHGGLVIADEFPEWSRDSRECLREPLEAGRIVITRTGGAVVLPARFLFAANGNLCPCGGLPPGLPRTADWIAPCECAPASLAAYRARLSGPILDRMDLVALVQPETGVSRAGLKGLKERVERAVDLSERRYGARAGILSAAELERILGEAPSWRTHIDQVGGMSLRARHKVLRVALTVAALDGLPAPGPAQFAEAAHYRPERLLR